jgi:metal-responsive CopG/Arc/MetJ family transcriptional regulator
MGRPTIMDKKKTLSVSINIELDEILDKMCQDKNINKSKYIEHLIKKEIGNNADKS